MDMGLVAEATPQVSVFPAPGAGCCEAAQGSELLGTVCVLVPVGTPHGSTEAAGLAPEEGMVRTQRCPPPSVGQLGHKAKGVPGRVLSHTTALPGKFQEETLGEAPSKTPQTLFMSTGCRFLLRPLQRGTADMADTEPGNKVTTWIHGDKWLFIYLCEHVVHVCAHFPSTISVLAGNPWPSL